MRSSADLHVGDLDFGEVLPVPSVATIAGTARKPKDFHLLVLAVARDQHVVERHLVSRLRVEQRDLDRDSRLGPKLTATSRENRVTHRARNLNAGNWLVKPRRTARSRRGPLAGPSF